MTTLLLWLYQPIRNQLDRIEQKVDSLMTAVQLQQEDLDAYAEAVSAAADEISSDIEALKAAAEAAGTPLPAANVDALQASLQKLAALDVPDTEDAPHPDNTLPGDLPNEDV